MGSYVSSIKGHETAPKFRRLFRRRLGDCAAEDFELGKLLGKGSCGTVRVGKHLKTGKNFAVKILSIAEEADLKQAMNEKEIMLTIDWHPNIISLEGTCESGKNIYLIQEFAEGGDVFTLLRKVKRFDAESAQFYIAQTVLALEHLHKAHIVYSKRNFNLKHGLFGSRDLKPENLVLDLEGNLKITDFGYAKVVHGRTWTLCGTPEYLAPGDHCENFADNFARKVVRSEGYGSDVDWWCLGILIYEFVVGYPPFYDENPSMLYSKILSGDIKFPRFVDVIGRNIIRQLLQSNRSMRLGNMVGGVGAIKAHPFFQGIDFALLAKMKLKPPPLAAMASAHHRPSTSEGCRVSSPRAAAASTPGAVTTGGSGGGGNGGGNGVSMEGIAAQGSGRHTSHAGAQNQKSSVAGKASRASTLTAQSPFSNF